MFSLGRSLLLISAWFVDTNSQVLDTSAAWRSVQVTQRLQENRIRVNSENVGLPGGSYNVQAVNCDDEGSCVRYLDRSKSKKTPISESLIRKHLREHRGLILSMQENYDVVQQSVAALKRRSLKRHGQPALGKSIDESVADLRALIQDILLPTQRKLHQLSGIDWGMVSIELNSQKRNELKAVEKNSICLRRKLKFNLGKVLSFLQKRYQLRSRKKHTLQNAKLKPKEVRVEKARVAEKDFFLSNHELSKPEEVISNALSGLPAELINHKLLGIPRIIQGLKKCLHSITFPKPNSEKRNSTHTLQVLQTQLSYQKCIFQAIDYLYKFQMITADDMRSFFLDQVTAKITGTHLFNLFQRQTNIFLEYHSFRPDLDFLTKDWHTAHLHRCLADVDRRVKNTIVYTGLTMLYAQFQELTKFERMNIDLSILTKGFLPGTLESLRTKIDESSEKMLRISELKKTVEKSLMYFKSPHGNLTPGSQEILMIEYLLNFYFLKFIMSFQTYNLGEHFSKTSYQSFRLQLELVGAGLKVHEVSNRWLDCAYLIISRNTNQNSQFVNPAQMCDAEQEFKDLGSGYKSLILNIKNTSKTSPDVRVWLEDNQLIKFLVNYLTESSQAFILAENRNLWLSDRPPWPSVGPHTLRGRSRLNRYVLEYYRSW